MIIGTLEDGSTQRVTSIREAISHWLSQILNSKKPMLSTPWNGSGQRETQHERIVYLTGKVAWICLA